MKRTGVYPYAKHRDTDVWCLAYAFDDEDPTVWVPGAPFPERLKAHIEQGGEMRAWNAQFERIMWRDCCIPKHGFPRVRDEQWFDTAAEAAAMALPRHLVDAANTLRVPAKKDMEGNRLMLQMCRPRKFDEDGNPIWWDDAKKLERLIAYCLQDVRTERAVFHKVNRLNDRERAIYLLDQKVNDRGIQLDYNLVTKAREIAGREVVKQNALLEEATGGLVTSVTKVAKLKEWLATQGIQGDADGDISLAKKAVEEMLNDSDLLSPDVKQALESRQAASKSSLAKLDSMLDVVGRDSRLRGLMLYHGASTGRWTGKLVQPHNFPRGLDVKNVEQYIPTVLDGDPNEVITLPILSAMLRPMLTAAPGKALAACDFNAIEARGLAWLANDQALLKQFNGPPGYVYKAMGGVIYGKKPEEIIKPSDEYQISKNTVLGCGFGMGAAKFAVTTGVDEEFAEKCVKAYRSAYPNVPRYWERVNQAAINAVADKGVVYQVGHCRFLRRGGYLWIILPAGRALAYAAPKIVERPVPWDKTDLRPAVEFSGMNSYSHHWERLTLYGGLITENIVQAVCRDLLADAMIRVEEAGHPVVLSVHDEVVSEVDPDMNVKEYEKLMKEVPEWAEGFPIDAEGWVGYRYRK